jgi:hypothetical protein
MVLRGLWGSTLSRAEGNPFERSFTRGLFSKLSLVVGVPVEPATVTPEYLQQQVLTLRGDWK